MKSLRIGQSNIAESYASVEGGELWLTNAYIAPYDPAKWGSVLSFLKTRGEISQDEEVGLAGVYRFLSPGAHRPVGVSEEQLTRLGRTFALNMCWFLLHNHLARSGAAP